MTTIPSRSSFRTCKWGDVFRSCKNIGDSFFIPFSKRISRKFSPIVAHWNKKLSPAHFVIRTRDADGNKESVNNEIGMRVWRDA